MKAAEDSEPQDLDVEAERPVLDVKRSYWKRLRRRLAAQTVDLSLAGHVSP